MDSIEQVFIKQEPTEGTSELYETFVTKPENDVVDPPSNNVRTKSTLIEIKIENIENDVNGRVTETDNSNFEETQHRTEELEGSAEVNGETNRFNCPQCQYTSKNQLNLTKHMQYVHATEEDKRECHICGRTFKSIIHLRMHNYSVHVDDDVVSCEVCDKKFVNKKKLYNHMFFTHPKKQENVICAICSKVFQTKYRLKVHIRVVHPEGKNVKCEQCNKEFKSDLLLRKHIEWTHPSDGISHRCQECGRLLPSMQCYEKHLQNVHGLKDIECQDCDQLFRTKSSLNRHIKTFHQGVKVKRANRSRQKNNKSGQHECDKCNKKFSTVTSLSWHQERMHPDNKSGTGCHLCSKEFADRGGLRRHLKSVHSMETATCSLCSKTFKSALNLQRHVSITHAPPEAAKTCEICKKTFKCAIHLKIHKYAVHPREGGASCVICNKQFSSVKYLAKHEKSHNEKEYSCNICGDEYKSVYDVRRHMNKVHMNKPDDMNIDNRSCLKCGSTFDDDDELHTHIVSCGGNIEDIMQIEIKEELET